MADALDSVFRRLVIEVADHPWARRFVTGTRPGKAVAGRFVAGETLEQAMAVARDLDRQRITAMLDHLGENVERPVRSVAVLGRFAIITDGPAGMSSEPKIQTSKT